MPPRETSPAAKSEEKRMFSQAIQLKESGIPLTIAIRNPGSTDKESRIQDQDSGFHKQKFPGFQKPENPDSLQWSE